jgi:molybdenum-dependent DNA-binding transcriptional regulator ModE
MGQTLVRWDRDKIARELGQLHKSGSDLGSRSLRRTCPSLHSAAIHWFGSYSKAVEAAGIDYKKVSHQPANRWSEKEIIRQLKQRRGKPLHPAAMEREMPALVVAAYRYFGTYRKAVEAAGYDYESVRVRPQQIWNPRRIVRELKQVKKTESGLWQNEIRRKRPRLLQAARYHFGSYSRAARAAGFSSELLKPPPFRFWSERAVVAELQRMHRRRERLNPTHLRQHRHGLIQASARRFGSYRKAIAAAGIEYTSVAKIVSPRMDPTEVIARLATLHERGKDIRYVAMMKNEPRLLDAARRRSSRHCLSAVETDQALDRAAHYQNASRTSSRQCRSAIRENEAELPATLRGRAILFRLLHQRSARGGDRL